MSVLVVSNQLMMICLCWLCLVFSPKPSPLPGLKSLCSNLCVMMLKIYSIIRGWHNQLIISDWSISHFTYIHFALYILVCFYAHFSESDSVAQLLTYLLSSDLERSTAVCHGMRVNVHLHCCYCTKSADGLGLLWWCLGQKCPTYSLSSRQG